MKISQSKTKQIASLKLKKYRQYYKQYIVEGSKTINELLRSEETIICLIATDLWLEENAEILDSKKFEVLSASENDLKRISSLDTPNQVIASVAIKDREPEYSFMSENLSIYLENIQDPGNLGTIIRIADWFGIKHVICSPESVDVYNPKVIQSTMGSIFRINVSYGTLDHILQSIKHLGSQYVVYGTTLDGKNIYQSELSNKGLIVFGNESKGLSESASKHLTKKLFIPPYPLDHNLTNSLNISMSAAIVCAEFRRSLY